MATKPPASSPSATGPLSPPPPSEFSRSSTSPANPTALPTPNGAPQNPATRWANAPPSSPARINPSPANERHRPLLAGLSQLWQFAPMTEVLDRIQLHASPALEMGDEDFFEFCQANRD